MIVPVKFTTFGGQPADGFVDLSKFAALTFAMRSVDLGDPGLFPELKCCTFHFQSGGFLEALWTPELAAAWDGYLKRVSRRKEVLTYPPIERGARAEWEYWQGHPHPGEEGPPGDLSVDDSPKGVV
jgi:hypothetical protein